MTNGELLRRGTEALARQEISEAGTDAWILFSYVTGLSRAEYYLRSGEDAPPEWREAYWEKIEMRKRRMPVQQITGEQEFMGLPFSVNENVLIPRQDTEILVETVLPMVEGKRVLDLCTGTGCIAISLAVLGKPECCLGTDISREALQVAEHNHRRLGGPVSFIESDLFDRVGGIFDLIVSNPPYIPPAVISGLEEEVRVHEPRIALDGGEDGLDFYRRIVAEAGNFLRPGGILAFEIGHDQGREVERLMKEAGYASLRCKKDYAGHDRVVLGEL
ncbi:MAG: peptide chain release factor N(5)-glutamine methyltransferase [Lachnospiraceae bacterium]|nr:peptide chain release factor N(5)-glutamine methyltransferase [Lachnospiraceae bacterium]